MTTFLPFLTLLAIPVVAPTTDQGGQGAHTRKPALFGIVPSLINLYKQQNQRLLLGEPIALNIETELALPKDKTKWADYEAQLLSQGNLVVQKDLSKQNFLYQRLGSPLAPGAMRLYQEAGSWILETNKTPWSQVALALTTMVDAKLKLDDIKALGSTLTISLTGRTAVELVTRIGAREVGLDVAQVPGDAYSITPSQPTPSTPDPTRTTIWPLTFVASPIPRPGRDGSFLDNSAGRGAILSETGASDTAAALATLFNSLYGVKNEDGTLKTKVVEAAGHSLFIRAKSSVAEQIRRDLARHIDIPYSQVRLEIYTLQFNHTVRDKKCREESQATFQRVRKGVAATKFVTESFMRSIEAALQAQGPEVQANLMKNPDALQILKDAGFRVDSLNHPLTTTEILLLITFLRGEKLREFRESLFTKDTILSIVDTAFGKSTTDEGLLRLRKKLYQKLTEQKANEQKLPHLTLAYSGSDARSGTEIGKQGILEFLDYWYKTRPEAPLDLAADLPGKLMRSSAAADSLIKLAVDSLAADIKDLFVEPLQEWIREEAVRAGNRNGIQIVGNTTLVVNNRLPAQSFAGADVYTPYTPPTTLADLQAVLDKLNATGTTNAQQRLGQTLLGGAGLATNTGSLLLSSLLHEPSTVYNKLAPGVSVGFRPTILRDASSARLQVSLVTTNEVTQPQSLGNQPFDRVRGQAVETDVTVSAFDLLEVSTFANQSTIPGEPEYRIPLLEAIPFLRRVAIGPPKKETRFQESMMIVSVTILPRALDFAGGYLR